MFWKALTIRLIQFINFKKTETNMRTKSNTLSINTSYSRGSERFPGSFPIYTLYFIIQSALVKFHGVITLEI
jgi:hypothetical protein